jgi:tetratricopeptide (TPR) repeat protein
MISLADHAEKRCTKDDIRNGIFRLMLQICARSDNREIRKKGEYYHGKLPKLRHSREIYAKFVMEDEEYRKQLLENILYLTDLAECSIRQLILPEMPSEEKLFYYQKAAALYETVLDGKYGGFYDPALMFDYLQVAIIYMEMNQEDQAAEYVRRILNMLEKHLDEEEKNQTSKLLYAPHLPNTTPTEENCEKILQKILHTPQLVSFQKDASHMLQRWKKYHQNK